MATTLAEALEDRSVTFHWLLEFTAQGLTARYSESDVSAGGYLWRGIVAMQMIPEVNADPYSGQGTAGAWAFLLHPERADVMATTSTREYDWEAVNGFSLGEATVTLYRWPEGCALSEAQTVSVGTVDRVTMQADGTLLVDVVSITEKYDAKLPRYTVIDGVRYYGQTTGAPYDDDIGRGYQVIYGNYRRLEAPVVDTTHHYTLLAGHHVAGVTTVYQEEATKTPTLRNTTDTKGRDVAILDFADAIGDDIVTVTSLTTDGGAVDSSDGTYTGTASSLILNPCDQLRHLAVEICETPAARVDAGSFIFGRNLLSGYQFSTVVTCDDNTTYFRVASEVCRWIVAAVLFERGLLRLRVLDLSRAPTLTLTDREILAVESVGWGEKKNAISYLRLKYEWGYIRKKKEFNFRKALEYDDADRDDLKRNLSRYGDNRMELETKHLNDATTAANVAGRMCELRGKLRKVAQIRVDRTAHRVNIFDTVNITTAEAPSADGTGWTNKRFVVTGVSYGLMDDVLTLLEI